MIEPQRYNLLSVLQRSLKCAQKKTYLHRIIYIASCACLDRDEPQDSRVFNILIDSNIKLINDEYCEDIITGFGLFYVGYFINIVEGPEETLIKHLKTLLDTLSQDLKTTPKVNRMKILLVCHHINRRYYSAWNGRTATPPQLLERIDPTTSLEVNTRHIQNCIMKLYRISEYLRNQSQNLLKAAMDNISDICKSLLPEVYLLDFLLDTPALYDVKYYVDLYGSVPEYTLYHEKVWPLSSNFVPNNILEEDNLKKLMSYELPAKGAAKEVKEEEEIAE